MNLSKIDLNLLVTFEMLISEGSVSQTAQKLGVTQPAVSHSLKRLRDLLGDELLVRGPRGLQPTMRARRFILWSRPRWRTCIRS